MACGILRRNRKAEDTDTAPTNYSSLPRGPEAFRQPGFSIHVAVAVLGASKVGKSWLVQRLLGHTGELNLTYKPTSEDIYRHSISFNSGTVNMELVDTAGSYEFPVMQRLAIESADAFLLVYAVNNRASWENVKSLHDEIASLKTDAPIVVVGSKVDLAREVGSKEVANKAKQEWNCSFVETSSKCHVNINTVTQRLLRELESKRCECRTMDRNTYNQRRPTDFTPSAIIIRDKSSCQVQ